jgi:hypothetical protein
MGHANYSAWGLWTGHLVGQNKLWGKDVRSKISSNLISYTNNLSNKPLFGYWVPLRWSQITTKVVVMGLCMMHRGSACPASDFPSLWGPQKEPQIFSNFWFLKIRWGSIMCESFNPWINTQKSQIFLELLEKLKRCNFDFYELYSSLTFTKF